jgi:hypothetical protein
MEFLAHLIVSAALLLIVGSAIRGFQVDGALPALLAALVLGLVNALVKPVAVILTLPLTMITFGRLRARLLGRAPAGRAEHGRAGDRGAELVAAAQGASPPGHHR